ncbi:hypothetical protein HDIA_0773 [Hartmannibacter diazotrophicus]|uniref:Bacteriophage phiJL001 Gp84 C-terminal domain-containing protein n=1 Tax=Hartmannibacter diazotrophicus TaxID=1482074 RepID=A0A2C9D247_9HYPH|nr:phage BR0599 family protein [Hartmannibacter diazotrophicus]SON54314.1 hypothetical protein HDIA_0773 [Hartmannibacter diazotrophicus]
MTFEVIENSNYGGRPVILYEFIHGTAHWYYARAEEDVSVGGNTYVAEAISDDGFAQSEDASTDTITIRVPKTNVIAAMMNGAPPSEDIWVQVRKHHYGDTDAPIEGIYRIVSRKAVDSITVELSGLPLTAGYKTPGLRLTWGRQCPHSLYDRNCTVSKSAFGVSLEVDAIAGATVISDVLATYPDGWFAGGFFEWARFDGALDRRGIDGHIGPTFAILGTATGLSVGDWITVYPGCARTRDHCRNKFANLPNYGGFPHLPGKSPFSGDPVF